MKNSAIEMFLKNQRIVGLQEGILLENGIQLRPESMILDFGCGSGRHTYEHLDHGYQNVFGYDIRDYVSLRDPADSVRFRFDTEAQITHIPFPDDHFDFVFSTSVFEHVVEPERALREIYRVLKPGGVSLHNFPSKWRPIEPHIYVPFGAAFKSYGFYLFWAALGIRNEYQKGKSASEVAKLNQNYAKTGLNYPSGREIDRMFLKCFDWFQSEEIAYTKHSPGRSRALYPLLKCFPFLAYFYRQLHTRVVLVGKNPAA